MIPKYKNKSNFYNFITWISTKQILECIKLGRYSYLPSDFIFKKMLTSHLSFDQIFRQSSELAIKIIKKISFIKVKNNKP